MNKAEAMFRTFFEDDAGYVLFYLAHRVQIESFTSTGTAKGDHDHWDELRVFNGDSELAVFDDKPNFIRVSDKIAVAAYVRKAEGSPSSTPLVLGMSTIAPSTMGRRKWRRSTMEPSSSNTGCTALAS